VSYLQSHGWKINRGGTDVCEGNCGPGIKKGAQLAFKLTYSSGSTLTTEEMTDFKADAQQAGINVTLASEPFASVIGQATACKSNQPTCKWTALNWGAGWIYAPDYYPSGEELFSTGAGANYENYSDPEANKLILQTETAPASKSMAALDAYENYMAKTVPVVYFPTSTGNPIPGGPVVVDKYLGGYTSNAYANLTPEQWYFTK
jgi:peptide/nickel transport system substrate-binding protein